MNKLFFSSLFVVATLNSHTGSVSAASIPRGVAADHRVKVVQYDPNNITVLKSRFGYQTQITFAANETVQSVSIGDSLAWQAVPANNHLFVKPVAESTTNMTVLTNLNSYNFQLDSSNAQVSPTYKLQFTYPEGGFDQTGNTNSVATFDPAKLNWQYSFTGDKALSPIAAFDNGQFTYLEFKQDGLSRIPAIFIVDKNRHETLVNYHVQGKYVVVNTVAKQFTLRNGDAVTSIYNDFASVNGNN